MIHDLLVFCNLQQSILLIDFLFKYDYDLNTGFLQQLDLVCHLPLLTRGSARAWSSGQFFGYEAIDETIYLFFVQNT